MVAKRWPGHLAAAPEVRRYTPEYFEACAKELAERKAEIAAKKAERQCPHCLGTGILIDSWEPWVARVRQWCDDSGIEVAPDGTISRNDAARLVDRSPFTLRNWALSGWGGPKFKKQPNGRYRYSLRGIAKYMAAQKEEY